MLLHCFGLSLKRSNKGVNRASNPGDGTSASPQGREGPDGLCHAAAFQPATGQGPSRTGSIGALPPSRGLNGARDSAAGNASAATSSARAGLNASRIRDIQPENVALCDAQNILDGLCLQKRELGRGTFGIVVPGTYCGVNCAVKVMLSAGLDQAAIRELLLSPRLVHPNVVLTYASRCAPLTHEFFDFLEGGRNVTNSAQPRVLEPIPFKSEDGFGEPKGIHDGSDSQLVLHEVLHALRADTGKMVVITVQEYCNLGTLFNAIQKNVFQPTQEWGLRVARRALLRTAAEIARGLLHLHDFGVIHGDLKPANILLATAREDRRGFVAKVADFGLAHVLPSAANSLFTDSWGSIAYMAPEAFSGKISRATDVWAFGVCLWQMLTGDRPYDGHRYAEVVLGIKSGVLTPQWPQDAPMASSLIELGRQCLSYNPEDRPPFAVVVQTLVNIEREIRDEVFSKQQSDQQLSQSQQLQQ